MQLSLIGFFLGLVLVAFPLYVCHLSQTHLVRQTLQSLARMGVWLLVACVSLHFLKATSADNLSRWSLMALRTLLLLLMVAGGSLLTVRWARVPRQVYLLPMAVGIGVSLLLTLLWFWLLVVGLHHGFVAQGMIPLAGMLTGGMIACDSKALAAYHSQRTTYQSLHDLLLGNGATPQEAHFLFLRRAVQRAVIPSVRQMGTLLVLTSPVAMWSLLMAGCTPLLAVAWQALTGVAILFCNVLSIVVMSWVQVRYTRSRR